HPRVAVRNDLVGRVAIIDHRFEDFHTLAGDHRAAQAPDEFLALARKHRATDDFDPAYVAGDDVHWVTCPSNASSASTKKWSAASTQCSCFGSVNSRYIVSISSRGPYWSCVL